MSDVSSFPAWRRGRASRRDWLKLAGLSPVTTLLLGNTNLGADEAGKHPIPAKVGGRWPNDARDTFWYGDYETATRVARTSRRPILLVINRGAECQV